MEDERKKRVTVNREKIQTDTKNFQAFYGWGNQQQQQQQPQQQQQQAQQQGGFGMGSTFQAPGTPTTNGGAQYANQGYWGENEKKQKEMLHLKEVMAAAMTMMKEERDKEKQGPKGEGKGDRVKLEEKYFRRMDLFEGDRPI